MALTIAVLRPDLFRIVVESGDHALAEAKEGTFSGAWTHAVEDWELLIPYVVLRRSRTAAVAGSRAQGRPAPP